MSVFIHTDETDDIEKMNIDELFDKKQQRDLKERSIYNKLLNRVHSRIKHTTRSMVIDEKGNIVKKEDEEEEDEDTNGKLFNSEQNNLQRARREYNDTDEYKPTGALVYKPEMLEKLERKVTFS